MLRAVGILCVSYFLCLACLNGQQSNPFDIVGRDTSSHSVGESTFQLDSALEEILIGGTDSNELDTSELVANGGKKGKEQVAVPKVDGNPFDLNAEYQRGDVSPEYELEPIKPKVPDSLATKGGEGSVLFLLLLTTFLLFVVFINVNRSFPGHLYKAIFNENFLKYLKRNYTSESQFLYLTFYFFFLINGGIFMYFTVSHFFQVEPRLEFIGYASLALLVVYLVRHQSLKYLSYVYPVNKILGIVNFSVMVFNIFLGFCLFPINVLVAFAPASISVVFLMIGFILFIGFYLLRQSRGFMNSLSLGIANPVQFFIYLCACEIMPLLIVGKFLQQISQQI